METKIELEVVTNQLQSALDELKRKRLDRNLIHDYITEALSRVKKLTMPSVIKSVCDDCTAYPFDERGRTPMCKTCKDNPSQTVF